MPEIKQDFQNDFNVEAQPEQLWTFLWDIESMAQCIPGCEEVITHEDKKSYKARMRRKVGPFVIRIEMDILIVECEPPKRIVMEVSGKDKRLRSELTQRVTVSLNVEGDGNCKVVIDTHLQLSGVLATLGVSLLSGHIEQEINTFVTSLREAIEKRKAEGFA